MTDVAKFLVPPVHQAQWLAPYWEGVKLGQLRMPRCSKCGGWQWYPLESGPCCAGARFDWVTLSPQATVFSFTEVKKPLLPGVKDPYITGLVIPDDAPETRIASLLLAPAGTDVSINARARFSVSHTEDGDVPFFSIEVKK